MPQAILLIAHGSRRAEANRDLVLLAEMLRQRRPGEIVEIAYLELAEPTIPQGARKCIEQGATEVRMLPFFLSPGAHVVEDLQEFRRQFAAEFPTATFRVCPPLGLHPKIVDVLLDRLDEAQPDAHQT
jgi:sirohydrochlorin ferrochelatase